MKLISLKKSLLIGTLLLFSLVGSVAYAYPVYGGVYIGGWGYPGVYVTNYHHYYHPYYAYYHPGYYHYHYVYNYNYDGRHYHYVYNYNYR